MQVGTQMTTVEAVVSVANIARAMAASKAPLYMVTWRSPRRCVGNCLYCSYTPPTKPEEAEVNTRVGYKIVDEMYNFGSPWFGISGGGALIRKNIFYIIEYDKRIRFGVSFITRCVFF